MVVEEFYPNSEVHHFTEASTSWLVMASDGTGYSTLALLAAAGKTAWPGGDLRGMQALLLLTEEDAAGANGEGFYFRLNQASAPTDNTANFIAGGNTFNGGVAIWNLWIRKLTGTDEVVATFAY